MATLNPERDSLTFQCKDVLSRDIFVESLDEGDYGGEAPTKARRFQIQLFGLDATGNAVCLQVNDFRPFFYVRIPDCLATNAAAIRTLKVWLLNGVPEEDAPLTELTVESHKTLMGFNDGFMATFLKVTVPSQALWRALKDRLLDKRSIPIPYETASIFGIGAISVLQTSPRYDDTALVSPAGDRVALKVYEANIDPVLRFFHSQNVSPAGWITVKPDAWDRCLKKDAKADVSAEADATDVLPAEDQGMAPYLVGSWDIECTSSHGDFPIAKKTWRKFLRDLTERASGVPLTVEALCAAAAEAINGTSTTLSRVFLKKPTAMLAETLRLMIASSDALTWAKIHPDPKKKISEAAKAKRDMTAKCAAALTTLRTTVGDKDPALTALDEILTNAWPRVNGDEIIQIGTVLYQRGVAVSKHIWVLHQGKGEIVDEAAVKPPGADVPIKVYGFRDEGLLLKAWFKWIGTTAPDVLIGYNIFGFDSKYVWERLEETVPVTEIKMAVAPLSCIRSRPTKLEEKPLSSSAMGDNFFYFLGMTGRLQIDLLPYIRRNHNLDSYSLDNVSATFMSGAILGGVKAAVGAEQFRFGTKSTKGIVVGRYITLMDADNDRVVDRCLVVGVEPKALVVEIERGEAVLAEHGVPPIRWAQVKDDVHPKDIFRLHRGSATDRAVVARYCLQDCDLVMELFNKLEILNNSVAMAQVSWVPVSFIFLRGQGIKIESLIFRECRLADQLIEVLPAPPREEALLDGAVETGSDVPDVEDSYEGAIVFEPQTGIYYDPVSADDFSSLYPSAIISENISHDTHVSTMDYDKDGRLVCVKEGSDRYANLPGRTYVDIKFDILRTDPADTRKHPAKFKDGVRVARYVQDPQGTIPRILQTLLANRKKFRKQAETETDEFRKALLDALQLAFKLTANSLYGQLGSGVFKVRNQTLAASTTAHGRNQILFAKTVIEEVYGGGKDPRCDVQCIYGDTDSIFLRFRPKDPVTGVRLMGDAALAAAKELTIESGKLVTSCLKPPHDFEFDKIFRTFCLLSKKRYVGDMSEDGLEEDDFHRKSMGIVMKRRDNAPIVKYVYGGAIERLLDPTRSEAEKTRAGVHDATVFVQSACRDLLAGKFPMTKLTITKSLRADYKDPKRIAHKVLADRIGVRDPGNKPSTSDRIPFVYIASKGKAPALQGDRIETPSYIKEKALTPDYAFYITNQIAKPVAQLFGLAVDHMPGVKPLDLAACGRAKDPVAAREALAEKMLFETLLLEAQRDPAAMEKKGQRSIATLFAKK